jgi:tRNA 2-thiocytidine biosynthesis protein TtcA
LKVATQRHVHNKRKIKYDKGKLQQRLRRLTGQAIADFGMISAGDKVMVCLSGGKDSYTLLELLTRLRDKAPVDFELVAVHLDQKQPGYPPDVMRGFLENRNIQYHIIEQDTYSTVKRVVPDGKTMCGLCSRLRRGILYRFASENGFTRIALGHHRDDIVETLFLNMFFGSKLKAMPPKLLSDDGKNIVIRPLAYCKESDILDYSNSQNFPIIPCNLCGSQDHLQRVKIKQMLQVWEKESPGRVENIFRSVCTVVPSHLADPSIFDFQALGKV